MHYFVKLLVKADSAEEALQQAQVDADDLVERQEFDWYAMDGRWGDAKAVKASSKEGKALIKEGMDSNRREFDRGLEAVRYMLNNFSDDEIYNETFGDQRESDFYLSRYQFSLVYGSSCYLYAVDGDLWGGKVEKDKDLEYILEKDSDNLWVVGVDFHN